MIWGLSQIYLKTGNIFFLLTETINLNSDFHASQINCENIWTVPPPSPEANTKKNLPLQGNERQNIFISGR